MQYGIYIDQNRCMGCFACVVACKDWHNIPAGPASWIKVKTIEKGKYPDVFVAFLPALCYHCAKPSCLTACPANAIKKREADGIVVVDKETCLGRESCGLCLEACPYGAPQFGAEADPPMQKCDLCLERWGEGKKPVCVCSCPMYALDAGPLEDLEKKYGKIRQVEGFIYAPECAPCVVFKPKQKPARKLPQNRE